MIDVEDALASLPNAAERFVVPVETVTARARRRVARRRARRAAVAAVLVVAALGATIAITRTRPKPSVTVRPSTGLIGRADAIAVLRHVPGRISANVRVDAKLITWDDYGYALNDGKPPDAPLRFLPADASLNPSTPIWLIYVRGENTVALGHGKPAAWVLVFVDAKTAAIPYRISDTNASWPHWSWLPDRAGSGDRGAFCSLARKTLVENRDLPNLGHFASFEHASLQAERLLVVAPPQPREYLTTMRSFVKDIIANKTPDVSNRAYAAALAGLNRIVRDECHLDPGLSIFSSGGYSSRPDPSG